MIKYILIILGLIVTSFIYNSVLIAKLGAAVILVMCILLGKKERYIANPYFLFILCPLSLLVYYNFGDMFMVNLTVDTINLGVINMLVFVASLYYTPKCNPSRGFITLSNNRSLISHAIFFWILSELSLAIPQLSSILWIFVVPAYVCALKTKNKYVFLAVILLIASSFIIGGLSKTSVMLYCMIFLICFEKYYIISKNAKKKIILLCCASGFLMIFSFSFANKERGNYDAEEGIGYYRSQGVEWNYSANYFMPYMYLTNGWTNLQFIQDTNQERTNGLWLAKPFLGYLQLKDEVKDAYEIESYSSFNTPTYIACGYLDFGYWGSIIVSLLLGIFVKRVYSNYVNSPSPFDVSSYILVALGTLEMFFSNHFLMQSYPITCVILMELYKRIFIRRRTYNRVQLTN